MNHAQNLPDVESLSGDDGRKIHVIKRPSEPYTSGIVKSEEGNGEDGIAKSEEPGKQLRDLEDSFAKSPFTFIPAQPLRVVHLKREGYTGCLVEQETGDWVGKVKSQKSRLGRTVFEIVVRGETGEEALGALEGALRGAGIQP